MKRSHDRIRTFLSIGAGALLVAVLSACEAAPEAEATELAGATTRPATDGPPPEGFETWEDYWRTQDQVNRDFQNDVRRWRMRQPAGAGRPW